MIDAGWFVDVALKSAAVAAVALLSARALRGRSAAERSSVLHGGLAAMALLPLFALMTPRWEVALPQMLADTPALTVAADESAPAAAAPHLDAAPVAASQPLRTRTERSADIPTPVRPIDTSAAIGVLYALPALALLLALAVSLSGLRTLREGAVPLRDLRWAAALRAAQRSSGVRGRVELLHSTDVASPLSWGLRRRIIVLDAESIEPEAADALLAHELAHLARHDWLKLLFARVVTAVYWFNPLAWMLARRCHQLREEAADDAVLRNDVAGVDYAELLLRFARSQSTRSTLAAHAMVERSAKRHLSQRLARVLDDDERRAPAMRAWSIACATAAITFVLPLAALAPTFTPAFAATPSPAAVLTALPEPMIAAAVTGDSTLSFSIAPRRTPQAGVVQVTFEEITDRGRSTHSSGLPLASLQGLTAATLASEQPQAADFAVVREAGTLRCEGSARRGHASGTCRFAPDATFAAGLERRGVGRVTEREQLMLMLQDAQLAVLDELKRQGYETPDVERYVELSIHGANVAWLRSLQSVGMKAESLKRLVEFLIHDVDAAFIADMKAAGYGDLSPRQLVEFRIHDVTAESILGLAEAGFAGMPAKQLVAMHIHDVTPAFARDMKALGYGDVDADRLVEFRIHDVTPDFVRQMADLGYRDLPARRLVEFRIHNVSPSFVKEIDALGYRNVAPRDLVAMQIHGVSPSYIRAQQGKARGEPLSVEELVDRRIHGY